MSRLIKKAFYRLISKGIYYFHYFSPCDKNTIILESKPDFSDNAKALFDYLINNNDKGLTIYWIVDNPEEYSEFQQKNVFFLPRRLTSINEIPHNTISIALKSGYLFSTHGFTVKKEIYGRSDQIYIRLWHGCGYKANERERIKKRDFDYALVPGDIFIKTKSEFWHADPERILPLGLPRYDWFKNQKDHNYVSQLIPSITLPTRIIIWLPTFRNSKIGDYPENTIADFPIIHTQDDLEKLNQLCKEHNIHIVIKLHQFQKEYSIFDFENVSNIHEINDDLFRLNNTNLYEFLTATDALISDYSSIAVDYLLLDKPIAFLLDDFEEYKKTRGFVFQDPLEYMPGYHIYFYEQLKQFVIDVDCKKDIYKEERARIIPKMHNRCDNYSERVWKTIKNK